MVQYIEDQTKDVDWKFVNVPKEHEEGLNYLTSHCLPNRNVLYTEQYT